MAGAIILKNPKIVISRQWFEKSERNLAQLRIFALQICPALKISNFYKLKMADSRHLKKSNNGHIWVTV